MTEGKWFYKTNPHFCAVQTKNEYIAETITETDAKFICLAGNLAQRYNLEALPGVVELFKSFVAEEIYKEVSKYPITVFEDEAIKLIEQALSKIEVK